MLCSSFAPFQAPKPHKTRLEIETRIPAAARLSAFFGAVPKGDKESVVIYKNSLGGTQNTIAKRKVNSLNFQNL